MNFSVPVLVSFASVALATSFEPFRSCALTPVTARSVVMTSFGVLPARFADSVRVLSPSVAPACGAGADVLGAGVGVAPVGGVVVGAGVGAAAGTASSADAE